MISHRNSEKKQMEVNDNARGTYNTGSKIEFKTTMLKSSVCDQSDAYILAQGNITVAEAGVDIAAKIADEKYKQAISNCAPFNNCITEINNTQTDNAKDVSKCCDADE